MWAAVLVALLLGAPPSSKAYVEDVRFALDRLEEHCEHFFKLKDIAWGKVRREFLKQARKVRSDEEHWLLLVRLVARLKDGHAAVMPGEKAGTLAWPGPKAEAGPGMFWCRIGDDYYVKNAFGDAEKAGVGPGMKIVEVDGTKANAWVERLLEQRDDLFGASTPHQALFHALHWGLAGEQGSRLKLELLRPDGKRKKVTLARTSRSFVPWGPVFFPEGLQRIGRQSYGRLPSGHGYIHLRDVPGELPAQLDTMLEALGDAPGLVLDCRANGGGACDHDDAFGRFVAAGETLALNPKKRYGSRGAHPYAGPVVVIVDAGVRSAGETFSGIFKEDGRAYMIGPSATAGMSGAKREIELPSGLFRLRVVVASHKGRFNRGRGIEGIGVPPHEIVPYDPEDLAAGVDTQIERAVQLLEQGFPKNTVPYKPERFGWKR